MAGDDELDDIDAEPWAAVMDGTLSVDDIGDEQIRQIFGLYGVSYVGILIQMAGDFQDNQTMARVAGEAIKLANRFKELFPLLPTQEDALNAWIIIAEHMKISAKPGGPEPGR